MKPSIMIMSVEHVEHPTYGVTAAARKCLQRQWAQYSNSLICWRNFQSVVACPPSWVRAAQRRIPKMQTIRLLTPKPAASSVPFDFQDGRIAQREFLDFASLDTRCLTGLLLMQRMRIVPQERANVWENDTLLSNRDLLTLVSR